MTIRRDGRFRLYTDEDSQYADLLTGLRAAGIDVVTSAERGANGQTDERQFQYALTERRVLITANIADFRRLAAELQRQGRSHPGLIMRRQDLGVGEQIRRVVRIWERVSAAQMVDREEFLSAWGEGQG